MYTWGEYNAPEVIKEFETKNSLDFTLDSYNSNEQLIAKLTAAKGTSGYDIIVPTGPFIPALVENDLVQELDLSRITELRQPRGAVHRPAVGPGQQVLGLQGLGHHRATPTTPRKIDVEMSTWQDFIDVAMNEASGNVSMLDSPDNAVGLYLWANDINWMTTETADLDAAEDFLVERTRAAREGVRFLPRRRRHAERQLRPGACLER